MNHWLQGAIANWIWLQWEIWESQSTQCNCAGYRMRNAHSLPWQPSQGSCNCSQDPIWPSTSFITAANANYVPTLWWALGSQLSLNEFIHYNTQKERHMWWSTHMVVCPHWIGDIFPRPSSGCLNWMYWTLYIFSYIHPWYSLTDNIMHSEILAVITNNKIEKYTVIKTFILRV